MELNERHNKSMDMDDSSAIRIPKSEIRIKRKFIRDESPTLYQNGSQNISSKKSKADFDPEAPKKVDYL